ncbi:MAG TPA: DNA-processing protein DprA [Candidatus Saccharimonadales bacterium]|nr:DNA-processing protein DprA [Candidatus Saccharimonadales bacterium]
MKVQKLTLRQDAYPSQLKQLSSPPKELYYLGADPSEWLSRPRVAMVGSRSVTPYGRQVTERFARELAEHGVVIISGLALGVDAIAHTACLDAGGTAVAVLANGLDHIAPATNAQLGRRLLEQGGTILSEYPAGAPVFKTQFIARNRIVAGLAQALLITEASEKSGTLHTARFAMEQGRDVLAVPGNIFSPTSVGTNNLIRAGATPVTSVADILYTLGASHLPAEPVRRRGDTAEEQAILDLLYGGTSDGHELLVQSTLPAVQFNQVLTMLELSGKVRPLGNNHWSLK